MNNIKYFGTSGGGLAIYNDSNWIVYNPNNSPLLSFSIDDIKIDKYNNKWIATYGLVVFNQTGIIGIKNKNIIIPSEFVLHQNFPNPFNSTTIIIYELTKLTEVELIVYNILGEKIKTLVNRIQNVGKYELIFDAKDLTSGIYFYVLKTENNFGSRKMIIIK